MKKSKRDELKKSQRIAGLGLDAITVLETIKGIINQTSIAEDFLQEFPDGNQYDLIKYCADLLENAED